MFYYFFLVIMIHLSSSAINYDPEHKNEINKNLGKFTSNIVTKYFQTLHCLVIVTDDVVHETFLTDFVSTFNFSVLYIQTERNNCSFNSVRYNLEVGFSQGCSGYIVQLVQPLCFLDTLQIVIATSVSRQTPRILFLPTERKPTITDDLFSTKQLEFTPDVLVVDLSAQRGVENKRKLKLITIDWLVGKTVLAECEVEECDQITVDLYPDKISNLKGKEIRVSALHYAPYVVLKPYLDGSDIRMMKEFARLHNCSCKVTGVPQSEEWGELYNNGTGTGVLGAVAENKADIGLGGLFANLETFRFLSITSVYSQGRMTCLVPNPRELPTIFLPFRPFTSFTWQTIVLTISITSAALYICNKVINIHCCNFDGDSRGFFRLNSFSSTVLFVFGILINQPPATRKSSSPLWFLIVFLQLMFLIVATTYCSKLAANVTIPSYGKPIETAVDLANSGLQWGATHSYWAIDFMNSTVPHHKTLLRNFRVLSKEQLRKLSFSGQFAFVLEHLPTDYYAVHDYITEEAAEKLVLMKNDLYTDVTVIVLRKGSPYKKALDTFIGRVVSSGIFKYWEGHVARKLFHPKIQQIVIHSLSLKRHEPTVISMRNVAGAFGLLVFGLILAVIVFTVEIRYTNKNCYKIPNGMN